MHTLVPGCEIEARRALKNAGLTTVLVSVDGRPLSSEIITTQLGHHTQLVSLRTASRLYNQVDRDPEQLLFRVVFEGSGSAHCGKVAPGNVEYLRPEDSRHISLLEGGYHGALVLTRRTPFLLWANDLGYPNFAKVIANSRSMRIPPGFQSLLEKACKRRLLVGGDAADEEQLLLMLLSAMTVPEIERTPPTLTDRALAVDRFVASASAKTSKPQTLQELVRSLGVVDRTLQIGCKERFGLTPLKLLRRIRLLQFRQMLLDEERRDQLRLRTATDVARFYLLPVDHFGRAFKAHFGQTIAEYTGQMRLDLNCLN